jgi:murein L,D-transpeptidase YcbB/YkuD
MLWIDRLGIDRRADSLMAYLEKVEEGGISSEVFRRKQLSIDMKRAHNLKMGDSVADINKVYARLEYNLTKAFLRYCSGQHFGYLNAEYVMNHCDVKDSDSLHVTYYQLFDIKVKHPDVSFFGKAMRKIQNDSVERFLQEIQPRNALYPVLCKRLKEGGLSQAQRMTTICNIERSRWCLEDAPEQHKKYVLVNVPSYRLFAVCPDSSISMRVGCGTRKSKTPLLTSRIQRMDLNPKWFVPQSIAKGIVYSHGYLKRNNMYIYDKKEGKLDATRGSYSRIMEGKQYIVQEGGPGNSLGRIIFRFPNNHAVYLHDTSTPWFFQRSFRAVSHGCIRVQEPFRLAQFLLKDPDEELLEKIRYSMTANLTAEQHEDVDTSLMVDKSLLIHQVKVEPEIPLFITYYTVYPNQDGVLTEYQDVYGYDRALKKHLKPFIN